MSHRDSLLAPSSCTAETCPDHSVSTKHSAGFTFDAGHLLAARLAEEADLTGDALLHFDKVGQEQDDLHFMVG